MDIQSIAEIFKDPNRDLSFLFVILFVWLLKYEIDRNKKREEALMAHLDKQATFQERITIELAKLSAAVENINREIGRLWDRFK